MIISKRHVGILLAINGGYLIGLGLYFRHGLKKIQAEQRKDIAASEKANLRLRAKIHSGAYNNMTEEQIVEAVKNDFEFFRISARLEEE